MAGSLMVTSSSLRTSCTKDVLKERNGLHPPESGQDLCNKACIPISYSDNHLKYKISRFGRILKSSRSVRISPFQISSSIISNSLQTCLFDPKTSKDMNVQEKDVHVTESSEEVKRANWVERLLEIRNWWSKMQQAEDTRVEEICDVDEDGDSDCDGEGEVKYDQETFSRFLIQVSWSDIKRLSKLAFLCNVAYVIPEIKPQDLKNYYALQFVTSSLEKKAEAAAIKVKIEKDSTGVPVTSSAVKKSNSEKTENPVQKDPIRSSVAHKIATSAAPYAPSRAEGLFSHGTDSPPDDGEGSPRVYKSEMAPHVARSRMMTVVVADKKCKQEAARDLLSIHSSPCEWFVCDDLSTYTRCFVIQGANSLASWLPILSFEPAKFESTEVLVHRGIYEAAKGIYEQFMPLILEHLNTYGVRAKLQFIGHCVGGSLSLLVNLMLLTRAIVKPSTLCPVVTFGSPFVFCGGQKILNDLGLDDDHVHCVMMHRDIVPRAFSCNYSNHVALLLKCLNGSFRSHPCVIKNKLLYSPIGKLFVLQPEEKSSPPHPLLPPGSALYALDKTECRFSKSPLKAFLNRPHPVGTLSNPTAYGSDGTISRDHGSSNYLKTINGVLKQNAKMIIQRVRKERNL